MMLGVVWDAAIVDWTCSTVLIIMFQIYGIGWFAKDPSILRRVGHVLLRLPYADLCQPRRIIIADDCFQLSKIPANRIIRVVTKSTEKLFGSMCTLYLVILFVRISFCLLR